MTPSDPVNLRGDPPPDAGMSLLGVYGLKNHYMLWLLNRRPDLLAMTPLEYQKPLDTSHPPTCGAMVKQGEIDVHRENGIVVDAGYGYYCNRQMFFRYVFGKPAWVCFAHSGGDPAYKYDYRFMDLPKGKLTQTPDFDLWSELGRALEGKSRDLVFEQGEWRLL